MSRASDRRAEIWERYCLCDEANKTLWERFKRLEFAHELAVNDNESLRTELTAKDRLIDALEKERQALENQALRDSGSS